jgi:type IV pilus assembly protein PilO
MNMNLKINFKKPEVRNVAIIIAVGLIGGALWYQFVYKEISENKTKLEADLKKKQTELNNILILKPQLKTLEKDIEAASLRLDSLKSMFPDQKEIPKLIRDITGVAHATDIVTTTFTPQPDVQKEYYVENRYNLSVIGGYHQLAQFFGYLANMPLIINLTRVAIHFNSGYAQSKQEAEEHGTPINSIGASFQMTTFSSKK